jgi:hypothetical protein
MAICPHVLGPPTSLVERPEPSIGSRFLTSTDESANGVPSQVVPRGAARADGYLKEEETE